MSHSVHTKSTPHRSVEQKSKLLFNTNSIEEIRKIEHKTR
jgi:hypothetical protein